MPSKRQRDPLVDAERLLPRVYSYVSHRLGKGPEAEDVTSEVFENALRYRGGYDPSKGEPIAWLLGIARNAVSRALAKRAVHVDGLVDVEARGDLEREAIERLFLEAAISALSERDQELIALRYGADLRSSQIAPILGMEKNAVDVALHRALARLRSQLESDPELAKSPGPDPRWR